MKATLKNGARFGTHYGVVACGNRFLHPIPLTPLLMAALLVLPQVFYPLHARNHFAGAGHGDCCHDACIAATPSDESRAGATPLLHTSHDYVVHEHNDCTLCLAYKLNGGAKTLHAKPITLPIAFPVRTAAPVTVTPLLVLAIRSSAPRAPPRAFVS